MKIKKNINNNVSLCVDAKGNDVVIFGKGVGFIKPGNDVELSRIERSFYGLNQQYIDMLSSITIESLRIADIILNYAVDKNICEFNGSLLFGLADHIDYAIERYKKDININLAILNDVVLLYDNEMEVGRYALKVIDDQLGLKLPDVEAAYIALNIINSEYNSLKYKAKMNDQIIDEVTDIIEKHFDIHINKSSFNYSRFVSHMYYLFKREEKKNDKDKSNNNKLYTTMIESYPNVYNCLNKINSYFEEKNHWKLNNDECLYLMLHINRLCDKESIN